MTAKPKKPKKPSDRTAILAALMTACDERHAEAVIDHRIKTVKAPLTVFAAELLAKRFMEWGDGNQAAEIMIEKGWRGFEPGWVRDRMQPRHAPLQIERPRSRDMADYASDLLARFPDDNATHRH